jgi:translocation and assembly module TamB
MTRRGKILAISGAAGLLLVASIVVTGVVAVESGWLREKIRARIVAEAEKATGGKVEIGSFSLDWKARIVEVDGLTIHGAEPNGAAPLLYVQRLVVGFRVLSLFERKFDVAAVRAESPRAHVIIEADGSTNLPPARVPSGMTAPETILDLKVGKFEVANGLFAITREGNVDVTPWSGSGEALNAQVTYNAKGPRYDAKISVAPVDAEWNGVRLRAQVAATGSLEKNLVRLGEATVKTGDSQFEFTDVLVNGFRMPTTTGRYRARVSLADADRVFHLVNFKHSGVVNATGDLRFISKNEYVVTGSVRGAGIVYGEVRDIGIAVNVQVTPDEIDLRSMVVNALGGEIRADGEVRKLENFHVAGSLQGFDTNQLEAVAGMRRAPYNGVVSGPFDAMGKLREKDLHNLVAGATLEVTPVDGGVPVHGEITAKFTGATDTVELGNSWLSLPSTRIDVAGVLGQRLDVKLQSRDLKDLEPILKGRALPASFPAQQGSVEFEGSVTGPLSGEATALRIAGHGAVRNAVYEGRRIDSLAGNFTATKSQITVNDVALTSENLRSHVSGSIGLTNWEPDSKSPVDANVQLSNADLETLFALAGQKPLPVSGTLTTTARITGTVGDPHATADLNVVKGQIYGEPYDSATGRVQYSGAGGEVLTATISSGRKRVTVSAKLATAKLEGPDKLSFTVSTNAMAINDIALARREEPTLRGTAQVKADGVVRIDKRKPIQIEDLNANVNATGLRLDNRALGDARLVATTKNGVVTAMLDSDVAKSVIHGDGTLRLTADYPLSAKLTFSNLGLNAVTSLLGENAPKNLKLDGSAAGEVLVNGSASTPDSLTASIDVTQAEVHPVAVTGDARNIANLVLKNEGPLRVTLSKSILRVESAHFTAPSTDLTVGGTIALRGESPLNLQVQGNMNLALAETLNPDLTSSGQLNVNATVRGDFSDPDVSGRAVLQKGDFHLANFSNGLTNAKGTILFSGTRATIQSLTAESGGGNVDVTGFAALTGGIETFRIEAKTKGVRLRYPEGVSTVSDSDLTLAGTSQRNEASGTVTVRRVSINPKSDVSTILAATAQPLKAPEASNAFLANMHLDVQIETAPDVAFETSVAQSIEAGANLRLRGTAANPTVLGRINVTQGELAFFGNKYTISQGSVSFFNPARIDPILNVDLETKARGVDVVLTVTGPLNKLNVSYRSDPPLQFSDIVALLATGRTPTDPTLAVRDTGQSQSLQQMGASALIGQAIASPVAGRLERFFGVSRIKIDPQLTGITGSPEARLTLEQQVTPELLFTYITDVSSTSTQLIRVEWDFNPRWAAILTREENGYVGVDFAYKKRFK